MTGRNYEIKELLQQFKAGGLSEKEAENAIRSLSFEDLGYAKIDYGREARVGYPEVIFCEGKASEQITGIVANMLAKSEKNILCTGFPRRPSPPFWRRTPGGIS
jgi:NCAIR mutase (PurE)-related protein